MRPLDLDSSVPLYRQVYQRLRQSILTGEYGVGAKIPSSRYLSSELKVSRITITQAFDLLQAEGYIRSEHGSGMYVAYEIPHINFEPAPKAYEAFDANPQKGALATRILQRTSANFDTFPKRMWSKALRNAVLDLNEEDFLTFDSTGLRQTRELLANRLLETYGMHANSGNVFITSSVDQCISIATTTFCRTADLVLVDDPCPSHVRNALLSQGLEVESVEEYLFTGSRKRLLRKTPTLILTSPRSFPYGKIHPIKRKVELLNFANRYGCYLLEDNSEEELHVGGAIASSLQELDPDRVLYMSDLGRSFAPYLGIAFIACPADLSAELLATKSRLGAHAGPENQKALAQIMESGEFEMQTLRFRKRSRKNRTKLESKLDEMFGKTAQICGESHLCLTIRFKSSEERIAAQSLLEANDLHYEPLQRHCLNQTQARDCELMVSYADL